MPPRKAGSHVSRLVVNQQPDVLVEFGGSALEASAYLSNLCHYGVFRQHEEQGPEVNAHVNEGRSWKSDHIEQNIWGHARLKGLWCSAHTEEALRLIAKQWDAQKSAHRRSLGLAVGLAVASTIEHSLTPAPLGDLNTMDPQLLTASPRSRSASASTTIDLL